MRRVFGPNNDDVRRLIILDRARIHTAAATKKLFEDLETDIIFVPGGCTPIVQPADVCWNAPFKTALRQEWAIWRRQDLRTPQGNAKMATRQDVISWISRAWEKITEETVKKSFKACGISNALDGSGDNLYNESLKNALGGARNDLDLARLFDSDSDSDSFDGFSESDL